MHNRFLFDVVILLLLVASTSISLGAQVNHPSLHVPPLHPLHDCLHQDGPIRGDVGWIVGDPSDGYGVILHTTNGGKNWTRQGSPITIPNVILNDILAIDACRAWAVGDVSDNYAVILRTTDGGKTWTRCGSPRSVPDFSANGIGAVDSNIAWVVGSNGIIIHTIDGGKTWIQQASNTNTFLYKVAVVDR